MAFATQYYKFWDGKMTFIQENEEDYFDSFLHIEYFMWTSSILSFRAF